MHLILLNYHDVILECAQDLYTFNVQTDLMIDCDVYAIQNSHNSLILQEDRETTLALLYMSRYKQFTVEVL